MRRHEHFRPVLRQILQRRHRRANSRVVGDVQIPIQRHVQVASHEHHLIREVILGEVAHGFLGGVASNDAARGNLGARGLERRRARGGKTGESGESGGHRVRRRVTPRARARSTIRSDHSIIRSFDHSIIRPIDHSFDPSIIRPIDHSFDPSIIRPIDHSFDPSIHRPIDRSTDRRRGRGVDEIDES